MREPEAPLAPGVACERTYQMLIGGEPKPVLCRWFAPEPHPEGDWMCHAEVTWPGGRVQKRSAGGLDSAQALVLAFSAVGAELLIRDEPVYWSELDDDLGLPIVSILADDLAERKARFDDSVRRHPLWASVCAILSADWGPFVRSAAHENYQPYLRDLIGRLQERQPVERIAAFLGELRGYIDAREALESDAATDLVAAGKLRALVEDVK